MAAKLTTFSKVLITVAIAGVVFVAGRYLVSNGYFGGGDDPTDPNGPVDSGNTGGDAGTIDIGVVTWGGYAGGQYFNEGFDANENSRYLKDYGFNVQFKVLDDFDASREAFKNDEVDLLWCTIDAFPTEVEALAEYEPRVVFQADWSRGGDAVVVRRGINNVGDLKGKTIAVAPMTPSHTFLLWLLDAGGLSPSDVTIQEVPSAIDAADAFKSQSVDAAVVWSPDDAICVNDVPGARVLESTRNASHIIADVFIAKKKFIDANKKQLEQLYEGWMIGAAEINASDANKQKAAEILSKGLQQDVAFCAQAIDNVRLTTHGDNLNFFGLNSDYTGVKGEDLYNRMKKVYGDLGYAPSQVQSWRIIADKSLVQASSQLEGQSGQNAEGEKVFEAAQEEDKEKEAISTKQVSISFATGSSTLDENAKYIIDTEFTTIAKAFSNARIRIEGNTDNTGSRSTNIALSQKRAQAVANYLQQEHKMPANRFIIIGNGPDKPVADNGTEEGRAQNRRTDFELVAD